MFLSIHILQWEVHLVCETQVVLNDTEFVVSEISVFHEYHTTCLACAHIYVDCKSILMNIPQKVIVVCRKSKVRYDSKRTPFR